MSHAHTEFIIGPTPDEPADDAAAHKSAVAIAQRALAEPTHAGRTLMALARGRWVLLCARLRGVRLTVGRNFRVYGSLSLRGAGAVIVGDDVSVLGHATPWTYSRDARIVIGDRVMMGSARFGCMRAITIGEDSVLADVTITDTDFHCTHPGRRHHDAQPRVAPVHVSRNVWLAQHSALLPGASIGENSVVSFGAVCMRAFPSNVIVMGNPAKVAAPIPTDTRIDAAPPRASGEIIAMPRQSGPAR